jgi:hypothetical protein
VFLLFSASCTSQLATYRRKAEIILAHHVEKFGKCYLDEFPQHPYFSGTLVLNIEVSKLGDIKNISTTKIFHPKVDKCVIELIRPIKLPAHQKEKLSYQQPLHFYNEQEKLYL